MRLQIDKYFTMIALKNFIDRVGVLDTNIKRDFVMTNREAKQLRDEIIKLLIDKVENKSVPEKVEVNVSGGRW